MNRSFRFCLLAVPALLWFAAPLAAQDLCVVVDRANLRSGPGTDNKKTWEVYQWMPFQQVERQGNWYRVKDVDGDLHWIYHTLVDGDASCVTVTAERANVRKGPGTNFDKWFTVERYTSFEKIGEEGDWVKLEYEGEVMYIYHTLVWP